MKMKKIYALLLSIGLIACTEYEVDNNNLPSLDDLTIGNINTGLPIVHVVVDSSEFEGIYENFSKDSVIRGLLSYYDKNKNSSFQNLGTTVEIKGAASAGNTMKSLGFILDSSINNINKAIVTPNSVLPHHNLDEILSFRLRNSGNDFGYSMMKDLCYTRMAVRAGLDLELMYGKPVQAFVNGKYFGLLNLRTESNREGISKLNGVSVDQITLLKVDADNGKLEFKEGNETHADAFFKAIKDEDTYALWNLIDIDNYIDYIIYQDYIGNRDWPYNNMRAYAIDTNKFRFFLYDLDFAAYNTRNDILPAFEYQDYQMGEIYRTLREHPSFDAKFIARQKVLYTRFNPAIFDNIMGQLIQEMESEIPYLISKYGVPQSDFHWKLNLNHVKRDLRKRDEHVRDKYDL